MSPRHDRHTLAACALEALDGDDDAAMKLHLSVCVPCRGVLAELRLAATGLGAVPAEVLLDGPPAEGDRLRRELLRMVRVAETRRARVRRLLIAATVVIVATGGVLLGRDAAPAPAAQQSGGIHATATDERTGVTIDLRLMPRDGLAAIRATVTGVGAGERCRLVVLARHGTRRVAGSWLVSRAAERDGTTVDGSVMVAPHDVLAIAVEREGGRVLVTARI